MRIVITVFCLDTADAVHVDAVQGLKPRELHHVIYIEELPQLAPMLAHRSLDAVQCDPSHELSDLVFAGIVFKAVAPHAKLL